MRNGTAERLSRDRQRDSVVGGDPPQILDLGEQGFAEIVVVGRPGRVQRRVLVFEPPPEHCREFAHGSLPGWSGGAAGAPRPAAVLLPPPPRAGKPVPAPGPPAGGGAARCGARACPPPLPRFLPVGAITNQR